MNLILPKNIKIVDKLYNFILVIQGLELAPQTGMLLAFNFICEEVQNALPWNLFRSHLLKATKIKLYSYQLRKT